MRRRLFLLLVLALVVAVSGWRLRAAGSSRPPAAAHSVPTQAASQDATPMRAADLTGLAIPADKPVTARFVNAELREVLQFLGKTRDIEFRFAPEVRGRREITLSFEKENLADVLIRVAREARVRYTVIDEKTVLVTIR
jgi:type II secretory pathway component GspD/PulD (secretin)